MRKECGVSFEKESRESAPTTRRANTNSTATVRACLVLRGVALRGLAWPRLVETP